MSTSSTDTSRPAGTGRVVAELGRPATAAEIEARKAEASRLHRTRQTINNLVYSLLATLGLVLVIVLVVPRGGTPAPVNVDYRSAAAQGAGTEADPLLAPTLPAGWTSNNAQLDSGTTSGVDDWHVGLISPDNGFVGLDQGFHADTSWVAGVLGSIAATGSTTIDGVRWTVYDNSQNVSGADGIGYALSTGAGASTVVLWGSAPTSDFQTVASALAPSLLADAKAAK